MKSIKIGFAPTRRSIFSAPDAVKYANLTRERLKELGVEFVDITDINDCCHTCLNISNLVCFTMRRTVRKSRRNSAVKT